VRIKTIADLIASRLQAEHLVQPVSEGELVLDRTGSTWKAMVFESVLDRRQFLALIKGQPKADMPTLCRMHTGSPLADIFSSPTADGARNLDEALDAIEAEGCGVVV